MKPLLRTCLPALLLTTYLAGCGYKAPLFMPKPVAEKPKRGSSVPAPAPAPVPALPSPAEAAPEPK